MSGVLLHQIKYVGNMITYTLDKLDLDISPYVFLHKIAQK